jgi:glutamyl-tRNA synthetase
VGTAYIALFNYVFAKKHGGKFILRIEDTDRARSTPDSEAAIMRALRWVGLGWDEGPDVGGPCGPYRQSERSEIYKTEVAKLVTSGAAYRCFCTTERLEKMRAETKGKSFVGYDGLCRSIERGESDKRAAAGEAFVIRLAMPKTGETAFVDRLRGEVRFDNTQIDDQILLKSDGFPTYHLANVVDDHLMGITHVIRAEEWLSSTPKHVELYKAFGWQAPEWIHMPLLRNADKSKISKRKNPVSLDYYRAAGFLPEALLNYLGTMGWSIAGDREEFTLAEMIEVFTFDRMSLGGPVFDLVKLSAMNADYLRALDDAAVVARLREWRLGDDYLRQLVPLVRQRMQRLDEFVPATEFFYSGDLDYTPVAQESHCQGCGRLLAQLRRSPRCAARFFAHGARSRHACLRRKDRLGSQGAVHGRTHGRHRSQGHPAALRNPGCARPRPRPSAAAPVWRVHEAAEVARDHGQQNTNSYSLVTIAAVRSAHGFFKRAHGAVPRHSSGPCGLRISSLFAGVSLLPAPRQAAGRQG